MNKPKPEVMAISEAELVRMTKDLDALHRDQSEPALEASVSEWVEAIHEEKFRNGDHRRFANRRTFLMGASAVGGAALLAACGSSKKTSTSATTVAGGAATTTTPSTSGLPAAEMQSINVDAQLENLAVFAYTQGLMAAAAGKLGAVPKAVGTFATTAKSQHMAHAQAFNAILSAAGKPTTTGTDKALTPTVLAAFAKVTNVIELAQLALILENTAAQSYQDDAATLTNMKAAQTAATIMPVEMQHAAILYFVIGKYPGAQDASGKPISFSQLTLARPNSDFAAGA